MEGEALMAVEPGAHLGMLVGGIIVEDDVDGLVGRHLGVDGVEKADELLMPVTLHVPADDGAVEHVKSGKQRPSRRYPADGANRVLTFSLSAPSFHVI